MVAGRRPELGAALALALALVAASGPAIAADWRKVATKQDRARLREWRTAWTAALGDRAVSDPLLDPDQAIAGALPPPGPYRCRRVRPGGGIARGWARCRIGGSDANGRRLTVDSAGQRAEGIIYPDTDARAVFLGTWRMADDPRPIPYGRDARRDLPGWVERVGPARWRIVLPYPGFGATIELVEVVAEGAVGTNGAG